MRIVVTILIYVLLQNEVKVIRNPNKIWCLFSKNLQISDIIDEGPSLMQRTFGLFMNMLSLLPSRSVSSFFWQCYWSQLERRRVGMRLDKKVNKTKSSMKDKQLIPPFWAVTLFPTVNEDSSFLELFAFQVRNCVKHFMFMSRFTSPKS